MRYFTRRTCTLARSLLDLVPRTVVNPSQYGDEWWNTRGLLNQFSIIWIFEIYSAGGLTQHGTIFTGITRSQTLPILATRYYSEFRKLQDEIDALNEAQIIRWYSRETGISFEWYNPNICPVLMPSCHFSYSCLRTGAEYASLVRFVSQGPQQPSQERPGAGQRRAWALRKATTLGRLYQGYDVPAWSLSDFPTPNLKVQEYRGLRAMPPPRFLR